MEDNDDRGGEVETKDYLEDGVWQWLESRFHIGQDSLAYTGKVGAAQNRLHTFFWETCP